MEAGAASSNVIRDGYGFVEFTATDTTGYRMTGLSYGDADQNFTDIDYAIYLRGDATVLIYEAGTNRANAGTYAVNDVFRVEVRYGVVRYLKNGTLLYTSTMAPRYPLRVDTALYNLNAVISDVRIGNLVWTGGSNVSISGDSLTKTGAAGWDGGAVSTNTIESDDGFMEFTATENNTMRIAGLGNADVDQGDTDIEFGIKLRDDGYTEVIESGISRGMVGSYLAGDRFRVELTSGVVRYYNNGLLLYTSGVTPTYPLRVDTSLYTVGATLTNVSLERLVWTGATGVTIDGARLVKTAGDGWNANASSTQTISGLDGWMEFTALETNTRRVTGLMTMGVSVDYTSIDFAIELGDTGILTIWELGQSRGTFGSYAPGDRFRIEIQDGLVRYRKNGVSFYLSTVEPSYPLHAEAAFYTSGATLSDVAMGNTVWKNEGNVTVFGNGLQKTSGASGAWNAGAFSTKAVNEGAVEWAAFELSTRTIGLGNIDSGQTYVDVDFAIHQRSNGTIAIYESGTLRTEAGSYVSGDRFRVEVSSAVVRYYRNGTLLYTSNVTPTLPLSIDTAFYDSKATTFHITLTGDAVIQQLNPPVATPAAGTYTAVQSVTLSHTVPDVTIRYTTDGSTPTATSTVYTGPITVAQTMTIKAKAWKTVYLPSDVLTASYTLRVPNPTITPVTGTYNNAVSASISESLSGTTVRYTTNGSDPTSASPEYTGPLAISLGTTVKARAFKDGWADSNVATVTYAFKVASPAFSPGSGSYSGAQTIAITTATTGATLRYTIDGSLPTSSSPEVPVEGLLVDKSTTVKAQGFVAGWTASDVIQAGYMITLGTVAAPTFTPSPGTFTEAKYISISTTTPGATIRYTTDGTEPLATSPIYSAGILAYGTTDLRAKAFKSDFTPSSIATGLYVIDRANVDTPRFSPGPGPYSTFQNVIVTTETPSATIHYTTNGAEPTEADATVASGGTVLVDRSLTLKAKAWKDGIPVSDLAWANYQITGAISAGGNFSMALKADGSVWTWGSNDNGQLGLGTTGGISTSPVATTGISDVVAIATGYYHAVALKRDGTVWAWGDGIGGQLGIGNLADRNIPVQVLNLTDVIGIAAGQAHSVALKKDGTVWMWGDDSASGQATTPRQVAGLHGIVQIAANAQHTYALQTDGEPSGILWSWGHVDFFANNWSALGDGTMISRGSPVRVVSMTNVVGVTAGQYYAFAVNDDGSIWGWGINNYSQLGDGGATSQLLPKPVALSLYGSEIRSLAAGSHTSLAAVRLAPRSPNTTWGWGYNWYGAVGDGTTGPGYSYPKQNLMANAEVLAAGAASQVLAIALNGSVWSWGHNASGVLGQGTTSDVSTPTAISGFSVVDDAWLLNDTDGDGLPSWLELELGFDPTSSDTNGDGISDALSLDTGINGTNFDVDGDGVTNAREIANGTDPFYPDTDGDTSVDGQDCFPLDPTRSQCPAPDPGDTTPPVITLTTPTNATLIGSDPP